MASDVKLVGRQVVVEAVDLVLDGGEERRGTGQGERRALVHDFQDGLTINWDNDYPGGVTLNAVRRIRKDPGFIQPVQIEGGLGISGGDLHVQRGARIVVSDANPADDFADGKIYQTDEGLHVDGGEFNRQTERKPVYIYGPIARETIRWGDWSSESLNRITNRARPVRTSNSSPRRVHSITMAVGHNLNNHLDSTETLRGEHTVEFNIVSTFLEVVVELSELRQRIAELEAAIP